MYLLSKLLLVLFTSSDAPWRDTQTQRTSREHSFIWERNSSRRRGDTYLQNPKPKSQNGTQKQAVPPEYLDPIFNRTDELKLNAAK